MIAIAISDEERITKDDLFLCLQLISLGQQGRPISLDELATATGEGLALVPKLEGLSISTVTAAAASVPPLKKSLFPGREDEAADVAAADPWQSSQALGGNEKLPSAEKAPVLNVSQPRKLPPSLSTSPQSATNEIQWLMDREKISLTVMAEKGGMVFKHVNFSLESPVRDTLCGIPLIA